MPPIKRKIKSLIKGRKYPPKFLAKGDYLEVKKMRWDVLIEHIKKNNLRTGLEIGAGYGLTSYMILANTRIDFWKVIDPFKSYDEYLDRMNDDDEINEMKKNTYKLLQTFIKKDRCRVIEEFSENYTPEEMVDMVFIDGNHSYEYVKMDIEKYYPYAKTFFGGHDIDRPDTARAIHEKADEKGVIVKEVGIDGVWYFDQPDRKNS